MKPGINFPYQHLLSAAYLDIVELFQSWISEALLSAGTTIRGIIARYLQICDCDPIRDRFTTTPIK